MSKFAVVILTAMLLVSTVLAIHDLSYYDYNVDGYSGQLARDRRAYDPYTRERYFGIGYEKPFVNYGSKGPTYRATNTGAKSAFSGVFNLDTNTYSNRGRDPSAISNWDPGIRGFNRLDRYVDLLPYNVLEQNIQNNPVLAKGTARILSTGDQYGAGLNKAAPKSQFFIQAVNLPPLGDDEIYEAWIGDYETEYFLKLGSMKSGSGLTSQLVWDINRLVYMFDYVVISKEPYPDTDPSISEIVLMGVIDPARVDLLPSSSGFERLR